jgi:hypothetical protein
MTPADRTRAVRLSAICALLLVTATPALAEEESITIEDLMKSGWQIAGFASTFDNRSAMILFRHPTETTLVQCLAGYDVTRTPRTYTNCYRLR